MTTESFSVEPSQHPVKVTELQQGHVMLDCSRLKEPQCVICSEPTPTAHKGSAGGEKWRWVTTTLFFVGSRVGKSALNSPNSEAKTNWFYFYPKWWHRWGNTKCGRGCKNKKNFQQQLENANRKAGKSPPKFGQLKLKLSGIFQRQAVGSIWVLTTHQKHPCCHNFATTTEGIRLLQIHGESDILRVSRGALGTSGSLPFVFRHGSRECENLASHPKKKLSSFGSPFGPPFPPPQSAWERPSRKLTVPQRRALARNSHAPASFLLLLLFCHLPLLILQLQVLGSIWCWEAESSQ